MLHALLALVLALLQDPFVCPPCGNPCDAAVHAAAGSCPQCGMALVKKSVVRDIPPPKQVGIFIFEGVQIIDYTGPYEVFGQGGMRPFTVAKSLEPITTAMGMRVTPSHSFADSPQLDVLVLPGGNPPVDDAASIDWIKATAGKAEFVLSVCNGAFLLAKAGLLDGLEATTYYGLLDDLAAAAPRTRVVNDKRYVDNGKITTTAGLSSGIDGALHVVAKMSGFGRAQAAALNMEYDWRPDSTYARGSFADRHLRKMLGRAGFEFGDGVSSWTVLRQDGNADSWQKNWQFASALAPGDLMKVIDGKLAESWTKGASRAGEDDALSQWTFADEQQKAWRAEARLKREQAERYQLTIHLERAAGGSAAQGARDR